MPRPPRNVDRFSVTRFGRVFGSKGRIANPQILGSVVWTNNANGTATATWTTDLPSNSSVYYGLTSALGSTQTNASLVTSHSIVVTASANTYFFVIESVTADGIVRSGMSSGVIT